jgi:biuret amidohydrolase
MPGTAPIDRYRAGIDEFGLERASTALVVVDMQYGSAHPGYGWCRLYHRLGMDSEHAYYVDRLRQIVPRIGRLLEAFRAREMPAVFLAFGSAVADLSDLSPRHGRRIARWREHGIEPPYPRVGATDHAILEELAPRPGEAVLNKTTASGFTRSGLDRLLRERGQRALVFVGVGTNYCVESTLRDAADHGYDCVLAEDACGASSPQIHERAVESMRPFCRVAMTEQVLGLIREGGGSIT